MFSFLTSFELSLLFAFGTFVTGVVFSQKIKDWFKGVPSDVRRALNNVETNALGNVKLASAKVLTQLTSALPPAPAVTPPAAPEAPKV